MAGPGVRVIRDGVKVTLIVTFADEYEAMELFDELERDVREGKVTIGILIEGAAPVERTDG